MQQVHVLIDIDVSAPLMGDAEEDLRKGSVRHLGLASLVHDPLLCDLGVHFLLPVEGQEYLIDASHELPSLECTRAYLGVLSLRDSGFGRVLLWHAS